MLRFRLGSLMTFGVLLGSVLLTTGIASATCGGGEEEGSITILPSKGNFYKTGSSFELTVENNSPSLIKTTNDFVGNKTVLQLEKSCGEKDLAGGGGFCNAKLKCLAKGSGTYTVNYNFGTFATVEIECT